MRTGHATAAGTARFHARIAAEVAPDHARHAHGLTLSSLGLGTYLGAADDARDAAYATAIIRAVARGINVVDTASNYRAGRSEHVVGRALADVPRDEVFVASKAGFVQAGRALSPALRTTLVANMHCIAPAFLDEQLAQSRAALGLATIDCYYVHNPETQLDEIDRPTFDARMRAAFETLEAAVAAGHLRHYGIATWHGLREPPGARHHLDLAALVRIARELAGDGHHFGYVQLPLNPAMPEGAAAPTQAGQTVLAVARDLGLYAMASASILQGKLADTLAMTRTLAGLGTALVGMSSTAHVDANTATFRR